MLVEREGPAHRHAEAIGKGARGAGDEVVALARQAMRERAGDGQRERARLQRNGVAIRDKGEQRFQLMIAIGAARADVQREVDLCGGVFGDHRRQSNGSTSPA
ncbi:hypothetical protein D9M73_100580 [compost metagenome]